MYCKKCNFTSHDHLQKCPKCGASWDEDRKELGLAWMMEPKGIWLQPSTQEKQSPEFESEFSHEEPMFTEGPVADDGSQIPEALRRMEAGITDPTDSMATGPETTENDTPEALKGMDMRITAPEDTLDPVSKDGDIEFPGLTNPLLNKESSAQLPDLELESDSESDEIIGVDFSLDEDMFEGIEEMAKPDTETGTPELERKTSQPTPPPPADIEFADLLDLEELLVPTEEKR